MMNAIIEVDLHGLNVREAQEALDEALRNADQTVYRVRAVHGFNNGTALRDMIRVEYRWHMKVLRICPGPNRGQTDLVLREY